MSIFDAYIRLDGALAGSISCDEPMARHTTYHIGGPAALFINCETVSDLSLTMEILEEEDVEWTVVGKGSNLLVADRGYDGAVVVLGQEFNHIDCGGYDRLPEDAEKPETVYISAGGATGLSRVVQKAYALSLAGLEFAVGTPGSVGGAVRMNAGTADRWMNSAVDSVTIFRSGEGLSKLHASQIEWGYRTSSIPYDAIIVEVCLALHPSDKMMLHASMDASLKRRRGSQPLSQPSCGSVFRGTSIGPAGELIESCGLKGTSVGGAQISPVHANFIVNTGNASAEDVLELIRIAQKRVKEEHGVELRPEVRFLGFA